jgi:hypothetical protein
MKRALCAWMLVVVSACGVAGPVATDEDSSELVSADSLAPATISTGVTAEDAPLLEAARTGDPEIMARAISALAACHGNVTCPGFGSCAGWSGNASCGSRQCTQFCGPRCPSSDPLCDRPVASTQPTEAFRVCFNSAGAQCIEWRRGLNTSPRCGDPICSDF